mmetsp:Transcript_2437/g.3197  ORF Transcript_2437/g.3197 Transcript_2437/m.3197 type:complete len:256 (+) Transcript_2437:67-834(+)
MKRMKKKKRTKEQEDDDAEEKEESVEKKAIKKKNGATKRKKENDNDDSSDSDVPIKKFIQSKKPSNDVSRKKVGTSPIGESAVTKKKSASTKVAASVKKRSGLNRESIFYECNRGRLVQALLRRWWYAIDWPGKEVASLKPEEGFEDLPGFPGVHIATSGPRLGDIVDHRDHSTCPCFANLYTKPTAELQTLVLKAYDKQIELLSQHEPDSNLLSIIKTERAQASRMNCNKADKEATKAIKAYEDAAPKSKKVKK